MENTFNIGKSLNMGKYEVVCIFKNGAKQKIVSEYLTEAEAQKQVKQDIETNPKCEYYMLIYRKMNIYLN
jgi:hypothetical protein